MEPPRQIYEDLRKVSWGGVRRHGGVLDRLGASLGVLGTSSRRFGASWERLGASWGVLGASWGVLYVQYCMYSTVYFIIESSPVMKLHFFNEII